MHGAHQRGRAVGFRFVGVDAERQEVFDGRAVAEQHGFGERGGLIVADGVGDGGRRLTLQATASPASAISAQLRFKDDGCTRISLPVWLPSAALAIAHMIRREPERGLGVFSSMGRNVGSTSRFRCR